MANRYQLQIGERQTPAAALRGYGNNAAAVGGALSGLGKGIEGVGDWLQKRQDKWDAASVMNAQTEFARRMSDYMDNPETGATVKRKGGLAQGLTKDTDAYADQVAAEIAGKLENDRQKAVFRSGIARAKMPYFNQASRHEARELEVHRKQAFDAAMAVANKEYLQSTDNADRERAVEKAANAIRSQYFGAPAEYINQAIDETRSGMAAQWVAKVAQDDPRAALILLKGGSLGLLPETRNKLEGQIKPKAEIYEIQSIADELIAKYPQGTEQGLYDYVRKRYEGEKEEKILSAVKARVNERKINESNEETALRKAQKETFDNYVAGMLNGEYPTHEQIQDDVNSGRMDSEHGWRLNNMLGTMATAAGTRKRLEKTPGWNNLKDWQQDEAVMRAMPDGPTDAEHNAAAGWLLEMAFDSGVTDSEFEAEVKATLGNMRITRREAAELRGLRGKMTKEQSAFVRGVQKDLDANLAQLFNTNKGQKASKDVAEAYFREAVSRLDPTSTTYRKDVLQAMKDAIVKGVEASGKKLWDTHWFSENTPTKFGERRNALMDAIDSRIEDTQEYTPRFTLDNVNLPETREAPRSAKPAKKAAGKTSYAELQSVVDNAAAKNGVETALIRAVIQVESGWNTKAVSGAGARGIMQFIPSTAKRFGITDVFDAEQSINGGAKYLAFLLKRY
ncbi:MAG: transglycosylase SLT domain-containing protein, partial [Synergistaceae bacterium]|nr:transglycosylase SLT domain-containing protein [Synergistaceae bacterium]